MGTVLGKAAATTQVKSREGLPRPPGSWASSSRAEDAPLSPGFPGFLSPKLKGLMQPRFSYFGSLCPDSQAPPLEILIHGSWVESENLCF